MLLTADCGAHWADRIAKDFPKQYLNCGIAEANMMSVAAGLALEGRKPFVYAINNFVTLRAMEQISVDVCQMNLPVVIVGVGAGFVYSTDGPTHHGVTDLGMMMQLPLAIWNCVDEDVSELAAFTNGPAYVRIGKGNDAPLSRIITDKDTFDVHHFPLDATVLERLRNAWTVTVIEDNLNGPMAAAVAKLLLENELGPKFTSVCPHEYQFQYGSKAYLHEKARL